MIGRVIKIVLIGAIVFAAYKGLETYALLKFGENMQACGLKNRVCPLIDQKVGGVALGAALNDTFVCVASKQSFLESLVLPVRKHLPAPSDEAIDYDEAAALCKP